MAIVSMRDEEGIRWFFVWSSITDSPVTSAMTLAELRAYVSRHAAERAAADLQRLLPRIMEVGTSELDSRSAAETIEPCNRAGEGDTWLSAEQQLALAITRRTDPGATMPGVPQDMMCCVCRRPIGDGRELNGNGDAWCGSCWLERAPGGIGK